MAQQALYRKWRSQSFDELIGQPHVVQTLQNALESGRVAHAYIFSGPRGTGKTSTARILAKAVNCLAPEGQRPCNECAMCRSINDGSSLDLFEIDAASNTQVDKVRDLIVDKVNFAPTEARRKVYIIDEVHMLSNSAFNALLKTLEEPPPHAMFMLATTEIHKVPATILSRCQRLDLRRISVQEVADHLRWILEQEGVTADADVLELVARQGTGSMRDAQSLLDQLLAYGGNHLTLEHARDAMGLASAESVQALVDQILAQDTGNALKLVSQLIDQGTEPRQFLVDVLDYLRSLLITMAGGGQRLMDIPDEQFNRLRQQMRYLNPPALMEVIRLFNQAGADLKLGLQPQLPLELAIVESILILQEKGVEAAPKVALVLPDRAEPPTVSSARREPRAAPTSPRDTARPVAAQTAPAPIFEEAEAEPLADSMVSPELETFVARAAYDEGDNDEAVTETVTEEEFDLELPVSEEGDASTLAEEEAPYEVSTDDVYEDAEPEAEAEEAPIPTTAADYLVWWQDQWEPFKEFLAKRGKEGQRTMLRLKWGDPIEATDDTLTLGFGYSMHLEKVQKPEERAIIEQALSAFYGSPVKMITQQISRTEPRVVQTKTRFEQAADDPVVQEALRHGGKLLDVTVPNPRRE